MLPNCKQVTQQLSDNLDQPVTGLKWLKLKVHLLICAYCRLYGKQIEMTSAVIHKTDNKLPSESFEQDMLAQYKTHHCSKDHQSK